MSTPVDPGTSLVSDLGERGLIERIHRRLAAPAADVLVGIGDDAAVVVPERGALEILTTDALVEGVHFERQFSSLADVGYKAVAVNASDVAAMGGAPRMALLSLMLPPAMTVADVDLLVDGVLEMSRDARVAMVGGNLTRSPGPLIVDVAMTGAVRPRKMLTRDKARSGDVLYVTGTLGCGIAALEWLREAGTGPLSLPEGALAGCVRRYRRPAPRLRVGALLGRNRAASACMDLSDGLADAVAQLARASGTGAVIDAAALPVDDGAREWFVSKGTDPVIASVSGGDDYELLFTVPPKHRGRLRAVKGLTRGVRITAIGEITSGRDTVMIRDGRREPLPAGYAHF